MPSLNKSLSYLRPGVVRLKPDATYRAVPFRLFRRTRDQIALNVAGAFRRTPEPIAVYVASAFRRTIRRPAEAGHHVRRGLLT